MTDGVMRAVTVVLLPVTLICLTLFCMWSSATFAERNDWPAVGGASFVLMMTWLLFIGVTRGFSDKERSLILPVSLTYNACWYVVPFVLGLTDGASLTNAAASSLIGLAAGLFIVAKADGQRPDLGAIGVLLSLASLVFAYYAFTTTAPG